MTTLTYPPGPKPRLPWGNLLAFRRNPLAFLERLAREHGDISHFKIGPQHFYFVNHPDAIREVLVTRAAAFAKGRALERAKRLLGEGLLTSEGDFHLRQRRLAQPAFHRERIAQYADVMVAYAARARDRWHARETVNVSREMMKLTLAIAGKTLFDADVESEAGDIGDAMNTVMELFNTLTLPYFGLFESLPLPANRRFRSARERIDATIYRIIRERRKADDRGKTKDDLLSLLLEAQDDEGDSRKTALSPDGVGVGPHAMNRMTDEQIRDEVVTLFLAGHETTANALTWTWYLLSRHSEAETKLHAEVDSVLGDRAAGAADVQRLPHTTAVLEESMRLYPPAWVLGRRALEDVEILGYLVPKSALVIMSQYVMHRDSRYFPDPERFDPWRRAPETRFAYFPFGGGPRQCIGEHFAWMEGVLLLATIARRFRFRLAPGAKVVLQPSITLRPRNGILMTLEERRP